MKRPIVLPVPVTTGASEAHSLQEIEAKWLILVGWSTAFQMKPGVKMAQITLHATILIYKLKYFLMFQKKNCHSNS